MGLAHRDGRIDRVRYSRRTAFGESSADTSLGDEIRSYRDVSGQELEERAEPLGIHLELRRKLKAGIGPALHAAQRGNAVF